MSPRSKRTILAAASAFALFAAGCGNDDGTGVRNIDGSGSPSGSGSASGSASGSGASGSETGSPTGSETPTP